MGKGWKKDLTVWNNVLNGSSPMAQNPTCLLDQTPFDEVLYHMNVLSTQHNIIFLGIPTYQKNPNDIPHLQKQK